MEMQPGPVDLIARLADLQARLASLDPAALSQADVAEPSEQLAIVEKKLRTRAQPAPNRHATGSTLQNLLLVARGNLAAALDEEMTSAEQLSRSWSWRCSSCPEPNRPAWRS